MELAEGGYKKVKAFVSYWEHHSRRKVIEMVDFVGVMQACTDSVEVGGLVVGNLQVVEVGDFHLYCAEGLGELEEVEPFALAEAWAWAAGDLDLIP